jgi:HprK-related kinase A
MTTLSALSREELGWRLAHGGLRLQTGEFIACIHSAIPSVADGIGLLYADYPLAPQDEFADFHFSLQPSGGLRRWFRRQVLFDNDGIAPFKPLPIEQAFPMFEWGLNSCVSSRANGYLIVHAAVVEKDGCAAILPAPSGSGKSTLCAALVTRGWRLLSDELALLRLDTGELAPLPRPVSLKNASIGIMREYAPKAVFSPAVRDTLKGTVAHMKAPADSVARAREPARPAWIIFPQYHAGAVATLTPVAPAATFMRMAGNAFNYHLLGYRGFAALGNLVEGAPGYEFTYSSLDEAVALFSRLAPAVP